MNAWIVGYIIGAVVVGIVVVVLLLLILGARRTAQKAEEITTELQAARDHSDALRGLDGPAAAVQRIRRAAGDARGALTPGGRA